MSAEPRGTDVPVTHDPDAVIVSNDEAPEGGDKTIGVPEYKLVVKNFGE